MAKKEQQPRFLTSPAPVAKNGSELNWLYLIAAVAAVIGFIMGNFAGLALFGVLGLMVAYGIKESIIKYKRSMLRSIEFVLPAAVPYPELIGALASRLTSQGMMVETDKNGLPTITHNQVMYDVHYADNNTFTLWWRTSVGRALFSFREIKLYRQCVVSMGIIAYHVQQICAEYANNQAAAQASTRPTAATEPTT